jgi:hypothetical protein
MEELGCTPDVHSDKIRSLPSSLIRCGCGRHAVAGVEAGVGTGAQIKRLAAAISWHLDGPNKNGPLRYVVASPKEQLPAHAAAFHLLARYLEKIPVQVQLGDQDLPLKDVLFREKTDWTEALIARTQLKLPDPLRAIAAGRPSFRWYRALTGSTWSGRLQGLEICWADAVSGIVTFGVGQARQDKADSKLRTLFLRALGRLDPVVAGMDESREILFLLCSDTEFAKALSETEHAFESQILAGQVDVLIDGDPLIPVEPEIPFQFPALWWPDDRKRHIDALMRRDDVPWVAELKVRSGGQGNYYREGIIQAALYREFIRAAAWLEGWFSSKGLVRTKCEAVLVIPKLRGKEERSEKLRRELDALENIFKVRVNEVPWPKG